MLGTYLLASAGVHLNQALGSLQPLLRLSGALSPLPPAPNKASLSTSTSNRTLTERKMFSVPRGEQKQELNSSLRKGLCWLNCPLGPNVLLLTGPEQRAESGPRRSSGVPEKHRCRLEDPVHSYTAWWEVSSHGTRLWTRGEFWAQVPIWPLKQVHAFQS